MWYYDVRIAGIQFGFFDLHSDKHMAKPDVACYADRFLETNTQNRTRGAVE